jgi:7-cyano-7-deazaguanine synthase in queuosine biosynthesis
MTVFHLRTHRSQAAPAAPTILLDWFTSGEGSTIQVRESLTADLVPSAEAMDFLRFSAAVYCADRLTPRPAMWTRTMELEFAVRDVKAWRAVAAELSAALSFLSGDKWRLAPMPSSELSRPTALPRQEVDAVCLFSGGLDSLAGAVDLLAEGKKVCLVAHYEGGQAPKVQLHVARQLARRFGADRVVLRRLFLRPSAAAARQTRPLPDTREPSMRSRSLLFLAAGLVVASGYGGNVPLFIPENGFIGINVPLTLARSGSLSTRTTHPHFMADIGALASRLRIGNPIVNPYRVLTKGEILATSRDREAVVALARETLSCAHPEAPRYAKRPQGNCGYCLPCLIRRAALHHVGLDNPNDYSFDALREVGELAGDRGSDLRALVRSLSRQARPVDILRNGPVLPADLKEFAAVYERGRHEMLTWMRAANPSSHVRGQLPTS